MTLMNPVNSAATVYQGGAVASSALRQLDKNRVTTGRYTFDVSKNEIFVRDAKGGSLKISSDMLLRTSDGDNLKVLNGNVTIKLKDGTKVTLIPTEDGKEIARVVITNGARSATFDGVNGSPGLKMGRTNGAALDRRHHDGTTFEAGARIDDLFRDVGAGRGNGLRELKGSHVLAGEVQRPPTIGRPGVPPGRTPKPRPATDLSDSIKTVKNDAAKNPPKLEDQIQEIMKFRPTIDPNNVAAGMKSIDQMYDKAIALLGNPDVGPAQMQAISLAVQKLQNALTAISNVLKVKEESKSAIIRNLR